MEVEAKLTAKIRIGTVGKQVVEDAVVLECVLS